MNRFRTRRVMAEWMARWIALGVGLLACAGEGPALWDAESAGLGARLTAASAGGAPRTTGRAVKQLVPYPSIIDGELFLVACQWPSESAASEAGTESEAKSHQKIVPVYSALTGASAAWAEKVVSSLDRSLSEVAFRWAGKMSEDFSEPGIQLLDASGLKGPAPRGLGDTLATCEHSADSGRASAHLVAAEIRIRRTRMNQFDAPVTAAPHEWAGALGHELGHALGFQGHVKGVPSLMGLSEDELRRKGRKMLAGHRIEVPALMGLSLLDSGQVLGHRALSAMTKSWLARIEASGEGGAWRRYSRVGDGAAEIEWRLEDGTKRLLRFPFWREQLSGGNAIVGVPTRETREALMLPE